MFSTFVEEDFVWKVLTEVAIALYVLHSRKFPHGTILHRDLKPGNIFLDSNHTVKLGDFGLARMLKDSNDYAKTHVGTPVKRKKMYIILPVFLICSVMIN